MCEEQDTLTENKCHAGINWQPKDSEPPKDGTEVLFFSADYGTIMKIIYDCQER